MRKLLRPRQRERASLLQPSSSSIKSKAAGCCQSKKHTFMPGSTALSPLDFRAGIYCSGIAAQESPGVSIVTADDIRQNADGRKIAYWVTNDACPPSPGCAFPKRPPAPAESGISFADVWQFAQSPKEAGCGD